MPTPSFHSLSPHHCGRGWVCPSPLLTHTPFAFLINFISFKQLSINQTPWPGEGCDECEGSLLRCSIPLFGIGATGATSVTGLFQNLTPKTSPAHTPTHPFITLPHDSFSDLLTIIGVQVTAWGGKRMKTKWGTCNINARRIWLNLELVKKPLHCLEYIIVHEMVHLLERHHNERFTIYMNRFLPLWHHYRGELNRAPLGHAAWDY